MGNLAQKSPALGAAELLSVFSVMKPVCCVGGHQETSEALSRSSARVLCDRWVSVYQPCRGTALPSPSVSQSKPWLKPVRIGEGPKPGFWCSAWVGTLNTQMHSSDSWPCKEIFNSSLDFFLVFFPSFPPAPILFYLFLFCFYFFSVSKTAGGKKKTHPL